MDMVMKEKGRGWRDAKSGRSGIQAALKLGETWEGAEGEAGLEA
jgi:hypothetical protein